VDEEQGGAAGGQRAARIAPAGGLQTGGDRGRVEGGERLPVTEDVDLPESRLATGEVGDPELVDEVGAAVRSFERHRRVGDREQERREILGANRRDGAERREDEDSADGWTPKQVDRHRGALA
jgi:hypothetical protein